MPATFTVTGTIEGDTSASRSVYVQTTTTVANPTEDLVYVKARRVAASNGEFTIDDLPAWDPLNLPHDDDEAQFGYIISAGGQKWTIPAQEDGVTVDVADFTDAWVAPVTPSQYADVMNAASAVAAGVALVEGAIDADDTLMTAVAEDTGSDFRGALNAAFAAKASLPVSLLDYAVADGTNQTTNVQAAIDATPTGGTLDVPAGLQFRVDGQLNVAKAMTILTLGRGGFYSGVSGTTAQKMFNITAGSVHLAGLKLVGSQYAAAANQYAVYATGTSGSAPISDVTVTDCDISSWGYGGIHAMYVTDFAFDQNRIRNICYVGIGCVSCIGGSASRNRIKNITQTGYVNSYGIFFSRTSGSDNFTTHPRSADIVCAGNKIDDIPGWAGIDTHGGQNIAITGNVVTNCAKPIEMVGAVGTAQNYAPLEISITGNTVTSKVTNGTYDAGIQLIGVAAERATGVITGNVVRGHGTQNSTGSGGILVYYSRGVIVSNNTIIEPSPNGVSFNGDNAGFVCTGNTIIDIWSNNSLPRAVYALATNNTGYIAGNVLLTASKTATYLAAGGFGVNVALDATNVVRVGDNSMSAAGVPFSDSSGRTKAVLDSSLNLPAGVTGYASLKIPHGVAPTSPVNGDMWTTTAGLYVRINGVTVGPLS